MVKDQRGLGYILCTSASNCSYGLELHELVRLLIDCVNT